MAMSNKGFTIIDQVVQELQEGQTTKQKKANTVTTAVGSVATVAVAGITALIDQGTSLPSWMPFLVVLLGMIGTTYGVSKTKNGVTDSLADQLHAQVAARIDAHHFEPTDVAHEDDLDTEVIRPAFTMQTVTDTVDDLRSFAEDARNGFK